MEGLVDAVHLTAGECFLLSAGRAFVLTSDKALTPVDADKAFPTPMNGCIRSYNGGGNCLLVGGHFVLDGNHAEILLGLLPSIVHLREESEKEVLRWSLERLRQELHDPQPGGFLITQQLAYQLLVQALRLQMTHGVKGGVGWFFALADKQMAAAINAMHADPAHRWTVQALAERAYMSRTTFSTKFKQMVGDTPLQYLTRWRMLLAADRLTHSSDPIYAIALSLGYTSESAFSTAFKRFTASSPRQYGRSRN